jgi:crotonobetaine/carnitine-CoA ligase
MYGMSEAAPIFLAGVDGEDFPAGTSGRVNAESFEARVVDDTDNPVPPGVPGEIVCRPRKPHVMFEGYYGDPAATVAVTRNLWFHTGDIATLDDDGNLVFVDRKKDYLRRGGENISSFEAESAISRHPAVSVAVVVAVPGPHGEDEVLTAVVLKDNAALTPADLLEHCVAHMPYFAVPRYYRFVDSLPVTASQKVEKYKLRAEGVTPDTWDREQAGYRLSRQDFIRPQPACTPAPISGSSISGDMASSG